MKLTKRTPLRERAFPDYTRKEEMLNMSSHIFGAMCAIVMMVLAVHSSIQAQSSLKLACSIIYTSTVLVAMLMSSIYHGLPKGMPKQVMRVVDHCDIFFTIAGCYTPITLLGICPLNPTLGWVIFIGEWALAIIGATLNAIDLKKYSKFSMACYIAMGWFVIIGLRPTILALTVPGFLWLLAGGIAYTIGAVLYVSGKKKRYRHFIFHLFVVLGIVLQFVGIWWYLL
ncbi:MAG: hemolysin III family protein [Bacteroidales bacterium]|nr:hemolysin III family protein [Bacteroidales bacterium]